MELLHMICIGVPQTCGRSSRGYGSHTRDICYITQILNLSSRNDLDDEVLFALNDLDLEEKVV